MNKGTVKFFNQRKGFGFIVSDTGKEVFVHLTALKTEIQTNDVVTYELEEGKFGPRAINVRKIPMN